MRAIVTGHSRGLGAALCEALLERGVVVLGLSRSANPALAAAHRPQLAELAVDLAAPAALEALPENPRLREFLAGPEPSLLVNNAGLLQPIAPVGGQGAAAICRAVTLNVSAALVLADLFVAATEACRERRILHLSSGAARSAYAGWSVYCATKAALNHHARAMHEDRRPGLRVCSLAPGVVDTEMQAQIRECEESNFPMVQRFRELKASGQLQSPRACARRVVDFLLSDAFGELAVSDLRSH